MPSDPPPQSRVLVADDEAVNRMVVSSYLRNFGHVAVQASSGDEALALMDDTIDLALLDVLMPGIDGFEVARRIRGNPLVSDVPVIMITALSGREDRLMAVEAGANDFISKPIDKTELKVRVASLLRMKHSRDQLKRYQTGLEDMVEQRTEALRMAMDNLRQMQRSVEASQRETIHRLSAAAEYKDEDTASHIWRMSEYSARLAALLGLSDQAVDLLRLSSPMHDLGKMGIPDAILLKPGKLTSGEWDVMKTHCAIGRDILKQSDSELLQAGEVIAYSHHERYDGTGYPEGLSGKDIPLFGRICAISDVFDALTTARPYKKAFSNEEALAVMRSEQDGQVHFDPDIFSLFLDNFAGFLDIQSKFQD